MVAKTQTTTAGLYLVPGSSDMNQFETLLLAAYFRLLRLTLSYQSGW